jgi:hypothetical protein
VKSPARSTKTSYDQLLGGISTLLESARRASARVVNAFMAASYWEIGRRIVEHEQQGARRAEYGEEAIRRLAVDLSQRFGRGFGLSQLKAMRQFFLARPLPRKSQSLIGQSGKGQSVIGDSVGKMAIPLQADSIQTPMRRPSDATGLHELSSAFPLPWSHYVRLLRVKNPQAREFYEREALAGG